jgi:hypothetical protein
VSAVDPITLEPVDDEDDDGPPSTVRRPCDRINPESPRAEADAVQRLGRCKDVRVIGGKLTLRGREMTMEGLSNCLASAFTDYPPVPLLLRILARRSFPTLAASPCEDE